MRNVTITIKGEMVDLKLTGRQIPADVIAKAMQSALDPIVAKAKALCPVQSGNLRAAISSKVSLNRLRTGVLIGIVGVRRRARGSPTNYAHLVEFGHATSKKFRRRNGTKEKFVSAKPFMRPAFETARHETAVNIGDEMAGSLAIKMTAMRGTKKINVEV